MTTQWRRPEPGRPDRETIGAWVTLAWVAFAAAWLHWFGLPPIACPFHAATGLPCPTCGVTRAFAALLQGRLGASLWLNPAVPVAAAVALLYVPYALVTSLLGLPRLRIALTARDRLALRWSAGFATAALWTFLIVVGR
ncbi:MAG TPA: DUF2752 domain-containing protein [Vicinamibacterales bacterium]|nr:DUF2752 domain-containing protein [Vicinamibacterales bacterium]